MKYATARTLPLQFQHKSEILSPGLSIDFNIEGNLNKVVYVNVCSVKSSLSNTIYTFIHYNIYISYFEETLGLTHRLPTYTPFAGTYQGYPYYIA